MSPWSVEVQVAASDTVRNQNAIEAPEFSLKGVVGSKPIFARAVAYVLEGGWIIHDWKKDLSKIFINS